MKTRQTLTALALVIILIFAMSACSGKSESPAYDNAGLDAPEEHLEYDVDSESYGLTGLAVPQEQEDGGATEPAPNDDEKIIYTGSATVETLEFDKTLEDLAKMLADCGGFIQYSDVTGADFNSLHSGNRIYRYASYQLRIPVESFKGFQNSLITLGNIPFSSTNAENITMQYRDTAARLTARQTEEARLLELLSKAQTVEDIMAIESRLSDVRYEIESLTSTIKNWDNHVSYSTLNLEIQEVSLYTEDTPATLSYGQQLKEGFMRSLKGVGRFLKDFFKFIVTSIPVIAVLAFVAVVVIVIVKASSKKKSPKNQNKQDE